MEKLEQGARLEALLKALGIKQTQFSKIAGVSQTYVSQMISGKKSISYSVIQGITKSLPQVNIKWLMQGEGEMFFPEKNSEVSEPGEKYGKVSWVQELSALLDRHEERIARLEEEVQRMKEEMKSQT